MDVSVGPHAGLGTRVSAALRHTLDTLGWSATKAAAECDVTARTIESLLAGATPSGPTLYALLLRVPGFAQALCPELFLTVAAEG